MRLPSMSRQGRHDEGAAARWCEAYGAPGCIPYKALLRNAELVQLFTHEANTFGITVEGTVTADYAETFRRSRTVAEGRVRSVQYLLRKHTIDTDEGWAPFTDSPMLAMQLNAGGGERLTFKHGIIAMGATARLLRDSQRS